ncbi:hypothetical protein [Nostoc sp.]
MSSDTVLEGDRTHYPYRNPLQIYAQRCIDKIHLFLTCDKWEGCGDMFLLSA